MKLVDLFEEALPKAETYKELNDSVKNGKFTLDGSKIDSFSTNGFNCSNRGLTSLVGVPRNIDGNFVCINNKLTSLEGIHKLFDTINGYVWFTGNPIKSHVLGLLKIKSIENIIFTQDLDINNELENVAMILNNHLKSKDIFACQQELIDAGLAEYAKL